MLILQGKGVEKPRPQDFGDRLGLTTICSRANCVCSPDHRFNEDEFYNELGEVQHPLQSLSVWVSLPLTMAVTPSGSLSLPLTSSLPLRLPAFTFPPFLSTLTL